MNKNNYDIYILKIKVSSILTLGIFLYASWEGDKYMEEKKIVYGLIGSGWRAEFYLRIAEALPETFEVCGVVSRSENRRVEIQNKWGVNSYSCIDRLLAENNADFIVVSVAGDAVPQLIMDVASKGVAVLAETPPAPNLKELTELYQAVDPQKVQVAEQYHLQPQISASLSLIKTGLLGKINYSHISISHGYHAISLIRRSLGIEYDNALIKAEGYEKAIVKGPGRDGLPDREIKENKDHVFAFLDFGGKLGFYEFERDQHRSWIRSQRFLVRGTRGEISNSSVKYLKDFRTPIEYQLRRRNAGENQNMEGYHLKGIVGEGKLLYRNPFTPARLSDDEIAVADCLKKMYNYVSSGVSFYSLAEACQDQYLALKIKEAINCEETVETETQIWAK